MDIHKPKAPHSWGELAREVGTIVIGILIALTLEEGLRAWHDGQTQREARDAVRAEIAENLSGIRGRQATQACIAHRLDQIGDLLARAQAGPLPVQPRWIGQPSIWFMAAQRWQAATGSGRLSLLDPTEQGRLAAVYVATANFSAEEDREQAAWAQLRGLEGWRGPLGAAGQVHFTQALQAARYSLWATQAGISLSLAAGRAVGVAPARPTDLSSLPHSVCLPIDTPRDQALRLLTDTDLGQPR